MSTTTTDLLCRTSDRDLGRQASATKPKPACQPEVRAGNEKTTCGYWQGVYADREAVRLPSGKGVAVRDTQRLFRRYVSPGDSVLEIGCAPGIWLTWLATSLGAEVSGLDYAEQGLGLAEKLFRTHAVQGDLRCEDVFATTFSPASFDVVYSLGVIEHFEDPAPLVRAHVDLVKPGGLALISVPRFRGIYAWLLQHCDPAAVPIHNLRIMEVDALRRLAPADLAEEIRAYPFGRSGSSCIALEHRWPGWLVHGIRVAENAWGRLQPADIPPLCPNLVLAIRRREAARRE